MPESDLRLEIGQSVARLTLNRPSKRNALTRELIHDFTAAVETVAATADVRLLVLAGEGPVFCAGMDLGQMQARAANSDAEQLWQKDTQAYRDLLIALYSMRIPTMAIVSGPALAGGLGLVLACDIVLAADIAYFSLPEPKRGITAAVVAPLLIYRIGPGNATYVLLSGKNVSSAAALQMGLCHEVVELSNLSQRADELIASILTGAAAALATTKQQISTYVGTPQTPGSFLISQLDVGMAASAAARQTEEAREGLAAFLQKRNPSWHPDSKRQDPQSANDA